MFLIWSFNLELVIKIIFIENIEMLNNDYF